MPKPYSADLRERVLLADEAGLAPAMVAQRFGVGLATVYLWRQQARAEGRRCAKPHGGGRARGIDAAGEAILRALVGEHNDRTLDEYREQLAERTGGSRVSRPALYRALRRLEDWSLVVDPAGGRAAERRDALADARVGGARAGSYPRRARSRRERSGRNEPQIPLDAKAVPSLRPSLRCTVETAGAVLGRARRRRRRPRRAHLQRRRHRPIPAP